MHLLEGRTRPNPNTRHRVFAYRALGISEVGRQSADDYVVSSGAVESDGRQQIPVEVPDAEDCPDSIIREVAEPEGCSFDSSDEIVPCVG